MSILPAEKVEDGGAFWFFEGRSPIPTFFVLRRKKSHPPPFFRRSSEEEVPAPLLLRSSREEVLTSLPLLSSDLRPILRGRRSKIRVSSIFGSEDRRWRGFFDLRLRRTKKEEGYSKNPPFFEEPPTSSKNPPASSKNPLSSKNSFPLFVRSSARFGTEERRILPQLRSSEPKIGSKIAVGPA